MSTVVSPDQCQETPCCRRYAAPLHPRVPDPSLCALHSDGHLLHCLWSCLHRTPTHKTNNRIHITCIMVMQKHTNAYGRNIKRKWKQIYDMGKIMKWKTGDDFSKGHKWWCRGKDLTFSQKTAILILSSLHYKHISKAMFSEKRWTCIFFLTSCLFSHWRIKLLYNDQKTNEWFLSQSR